MPYKNKADGYAAQKRHREKNFENFILLLSVSQCKDCGESDPIVLEFDHLPEFEKKFDIGRAVSGSTRSWVSILSEIDKCEVVCSNCHKRRTARRAGYRKHLLQNKPR